MKLGVFSVLLGDKPLEEAIAYFKKAGIQAIELGCGGYSGKTHCDPSILLNDNRAFEKFKSTIEKSGMAISALSVHGNPVHPNKETAAMYHADFEQAVLLAEKLGLDRIVTFSGCPGGSSRDKTPNWITCPWPPEYLDMLEYQWKKVLIPYWKKAVAFAKAHGVTRIALEMHPGFCVYNPETLLKLRKAVGPVIGANFDPSHLFWQGIDAVAAIRYLGDAIYYVHAKDSKVDPINASRIGVLDTKHYGEELNRAWVFRSVGYGHDAQVWKDIVSNLRMVGYDDVISIEHEDSLMNQDEGLRKAVGLLKEVLMFEDKGAMWWA